MGMYDTINGEQVKCFPWVSLYEDLVDYHGGDLKYYGMNDEVPYKRPHYNYGKNFIIFDLNRFPDSDYCCYDYVIHVIVDGKVRDTWTDNIGEINWKTNKNVISYTGELLNIKGSEDLVKYVKEQHEYWKKIDELDKRRHELFAEMMQYSCGIANLNKDSEEKKVRLKKIHEIQELIAYERKRTQPEHELLEKQYSKWFVSELNDVIALGNYISAYNWARETHRETEALKCMLKIQELLNKDESLYEKYVAWQESDEYIREFKK